MKIGILGCGHIAGKNVEMLKRLEGYEVVACAARDSEKSLAFAREHDVPRAYGSYEELCQDGEVEIIYITTVHSLHEKHMLMCLEAGKHVICEKAFTVNEEEAKRVFALAKEKNLFVSEAIWPRYQPARSIIRYLLPKIGRVTNISARLGDDIIGKERLSSAELGGGAILDIGVYVINFVLMAREGISIGKMAGLCTRSREGVDIRDEMLFQFDDGSTATMSIDTEAHMQNRGIIQGVDGAIEVDNVINPKKITLWSGTKSPVVMAEYPMEHELNGYEYEFMDAKRAIDNGRIESYDMPWSETIRVMRIMDGFRLSWGIKLGSEIK